jgi:7,8-dihydropterin-6-yl-methyl-4-(beta-D-ribofuranosyl)aminobenzene 5'-phosphate synthase
MTARWRSMRTSPVFLVLFIQLSTALATSIRPADPNTVQVTVLYDAFGNDRSMEKDWGYAALVEYGGKRILFDTGNNPDILAKNVKAKGVDVTKLDFVVMSHRHGDHMGGLTYILSVNPHVKIFAPKECFGVYGADLPGSFFRKDSTLPADQRYFGGTPPEVMRFGSAWPGANFQLIDKNTEVAPGIHLIALVSDKPGTMELRELSLAMDTPDGVVLVVGCSHPGIDKIVESATALNPRIRLIIGGFHLVVANDQDIEKIVTELHDNFKVEYIAPGHCTGEPAFAAFKKAFADHDLFAGLGTTVKISASAH